MWLKAPLWVADGTAATVLIKALHRNGNASGWRLSGTPGAIPGQRPKVPYCRAAQGFLNEYVLADKGFAD
jgi:hypothetical protein